jgi:hypothetical protein
MDQAPRGQMVRVSHSRNGSRGATLSGDSNRLRARGRPTRKAGAVTVQGGRPTVTDLVVAVATLVPAELDSVPTPAAARQGAQVQQLLVSAVHDLESGREIAFGLACEAAVLVHRLAEVSGTTVDQELRDLQDRARRHGEG